MAHWASRSSSPRTATVAWESSHLPPAGRGPGAGCSASTAAPSALRGRAGSLCATPRMRVRSLIVVLLEKLVQPRRELRLDFRRTRGFLGLEPPLGGPDLDALHRARPGHFVGQAGVVAQRRWDEDAAHLVDRALLRGRDEAAHQEPHRRIE